MARLTFKYECEACGDVWTYAPDVKMTSGISASVVDGEVVRDAIMPSLRFGLPTVGECLKCGHVGFLEVGG